MHILENHSLKNYNTFGIDVKARYFVEIDSVKTLGDVLAVADQYPKIFVLSGGSNMLLTGDLNALVLFINIKGIEIVSQSEEHIRLKIMAGENWHAMVQWTLENNYGGLENMSLIPGNTGTAPIQNIGAYGVELKDRFVQCEAIHVATHEIRSFNKTDCAFGYRDSYFKNQGKGIYIITSVTLQLTKKKHVLNTSYGAIETELKAMKVAQPTIRDVARAVINIRQSKLPDPKVLGNSGSFFKNPVVTKEEFEVFSNSYPEAPFYEISEQSFKIPAGWLIEQCGFKGKRYGDAGVHEKQALVLVNYGNASGAEIMALATRIIKAVATKFGIAITPEVNVIGAL